MAPGAVTVSMPSLRYWRTQRALLQQELADMAGVHRTSVTRAERGYPVRLNVVRRLAVALQVDPTQLMTAAPQH